MPPPRLVRRTLIDPLWLPVVVVASVILLLPVIVGLLLAPFSSRRRVLRLAALAIAYLWLDAALLVGAWALWLRQPSPRRDQLRWRRRHAALLAWMLTTLVRAAHGCIGYEVQLTPCDGTPNPTAPLLVFARHAGPGDSFTLVALLLTSYQRRPRVVLKQALQWDAGLEIVLTRLECYFLPSSSGAGDDQTAAVARLAENLAPTDALLLFPEGGNWTPRRHRRAVMALLRGGHRRRAKTARALTHVLPPRPGGAMAALSARPDSDVMIVAHAGLDSLVSPGQMWQALPLRSRPMRIQPWLHPADAVPRDEPSARRWLDDQWAQVDSWINSTAGAPAGPGAPSQPGPEQDGLETR